MADLNTGGLLGSLFPSLSTNLTTGGFNAAADSQTKLGVTPTTTTVAPTAPVYGPPAPTVSSPPAFKATVTPTMSANTISTAISNPTTLPTISTSPDVFQMADGRFYSPKTGLSGATRDEALGGTTSNSSTSPGSSSNTSATPSTTNDDVTAAIQALFPQSDTLVKQYQDLRTASGLPDLETQLAGVNTEMANLTATIQNIENDVRTQAAGNADESFIQATVADRIRRLQPRIDQLNAQQSALTSNIAAKKDAITQQLGFSQQDITNASNDQKAVRDGLKSMLDTFGSAAFTNVDPSVISELEKRAGLPQGYLNATAKTLEERKVAISETPQQQSITDKYGSGIIGEYNFYAEQEKAVGHQPLSFNDYQNMDANRKARLAAAASSGGLSSEQFKRLNTISDNFRLDPNVKDFSAIRASYEAARKAATYQNSLGDITMMRLVAKITDPTTGVREEEYKTFKDAQGTLTRYGIDLTKGMVGKGQLTSEGRAKLLSEIKDIYDQREAAYNNAVQGYTKQAKKNGGTAEDIMPPYLAPESTSTTGFSATYQGKKYLFDSQAKVDAFKKQFPGAV